MRKFVMPIAILALLGTSSLALAAVTTTDGVVKTFDSKAMTITLQDGSVYHFTKTLKLAALQPGEKVKITWDKMGANNEASAVVVVK